MPKYKVPEEEEYSHEAPSSPKKAKKTRPYRLTVPFDPKELKKLKIDEAIEIRFVGKVAEIRQQEGGDYAHSEVVLALDTLEYYPETQASKFFKEDEEDD